ncbi:3-isopropylmalate dehydratase small subunit [Variovorax sp. LjRoot178]|uniref:3-isopropylmalate dehydratase small subunit n=1 Tax=Variovorax sp. LjRoot178 TaxID=3342277 RepID=UPI003ECC9769
MQKFERLTAVAAPIVARDVDTDQIFPSRFLSRDRAQGKYGDYLLHDHRFDAAGKPKPGYVLSDERLSGAQILVAAANYACGSARPGSVFAHLDFGIRAILAESFGPVFPTVAFKYGLLTAQLAPEHAAELRAQLLESLGARVMIDLPQQVVVAPDGHQFGFDIDPFAKRLLVEGLDQIGLTMQYRAEIERFEKLRRATLPWLA